MSNYTDVFLGTFVQHVTIPGTEAVVLVESPFNESFVIDEPYTGAFFFGSRVKGLGFDKPTYYHFPDLQVIKDKKNLVRLLWIPYRASLSQRIVEQQREHYICYTKPPQGTPAWDDKPLYRGYIAFPLRTQRHLELKDTPIWQIRHWQPQTFAFEEHVYDEIKDVFVFESNDYLGHTFEFYDEQEQLKLIRCIQFIFKT